MRYDSNNIKSSVVTYLVHVDYLVSVGITSVPVVVVVVTDSTHQQTKTVHLRHTGTRSCAATDD